MRLKPIIKCEIIHLRPTEMIELEHELDLIVNDGFNFLCHVFGNPTQPSEMAYIAIGTDDTAPAATQTELISEEYREGATYTKLAPVGQCKLEATFTGLATNTYKEAGLFNASTGGSMFCRDTFSRYVTPEDTLIIRYTVSFTTA